MPSRHSAFFILSPRFTVSTWRIFMHLYLKQVFCYRRQSTLVNQFRFLFLSLPSSLIAVSADFDRSISTLRTWRRDVEFACRSATRAIRLMSRLLWARTSNLMWVTRQSLSISTRMHLVTDAETNASVDNYAISSIFLLLRRRLLPQSLTTIRMISQIRRMIRTTIFHQKMRMMSTLTIQWSISLAWRMTESDESILWLLSTSQLT